MGGDPTDAAYVFNNWTSQNGYSPIYLTGGTSIILSTGYPPTMPTTNPGVFAVGFGHAPAAISWDMQAEEQAVFTTVGWTLSANGTNVVNSATDTPTVGQPGGYNVWSSATASGHYVVTASAESFPVHRQRGGRRVLL